MPRGEEENFFEGDFHLPQEFLEQEAKFGDAAYHPAILTSLMHGAADAALAYYLRSQEKNARFDIKHTLRSFLISSITAPEKPSAEHEWILKPEGEQPFDPNAINTDVVYDFCARAEIDFQLEEEYQKLMGEALAQGGYLYGEKGQRGYDKLEAFANERQIPVDFSTAEIALALQKNLEKVCLGRFSDNLEHQITNSTSVDTVVEMVEQVVSFAKEKGILLDPKLAFDGEMEKLSNLQDNPGYEEQVKELKQVAERVGISLE